MKSVTIKSTKLERQNDRLYLRIDDKTKQHLQKAASETGIPASTIVRQAIRKELESTYAKHKPASKQQEK